MRVLLIGLFVATALAGCTAGESATQSGSQRPAPGPVSADPTGAVPANNPSARLHDALGRTPEDAIAALTDALDRRDWKTAYSLYASPTPNAEIAAKDWSEANDRYTGLIVHETRVTDSGNAWVRVTYTLTKTPAGQSAYSGTVEEPGEWWPMYKVGGRWKVAWMPRP